MVTAYSYVRMSTGPQLRGDFLRRQVERSEAFAAEHGLTLDDAPPISACPPMTGRTFGVSLVCFWTP